MSGSDKIKWLVVVVTLVFVWFFFWFGLKMVKYSYPDIVASAKDVPGWMVEGQYKIFTKADMLTLRNDQCSHHPIFVRQKNDGTAVLTCGIPAELWPVRLFVADAFADIYVAK